MQKFQQILTEAAQLKETQLKNQRKNYQSLPQYLKSGLNYSKKYQIVRKQHYMIQMHLSNKIKREGNILFKQEKYREALTKYQEALAIFRYINTKSYDNMKDEHLSYEHFTLNENNQKFKEEFSTHLVALYLNICSCLTKINKKQDAIHSADEAMKIKQTAKGYYKKAQAYLQYINRDTDDIKLGFYYLNKCYETSKDINVVQEMHKIKNQIDKERNKQKNWFKFMFDKNSQSNREVIQNKEIKIKQDEYKKVIKKDNQINSQIKKLEDVQQIQPEKQRLEKTQQKLFKFVNLDIDEDQWLISYQGQFIAKHGSKIYSMLQIFSKKQYLYEYKSILAQCLQLKKQCHKYSKIKQAYSKYIEWLRLHPIDKIAKYIQRYDLQTKWIRQQRQKLKNIKSQVQKINHQQTKYSDGHILFEQNQGKNNQSFNENKSIELIQEVTKIVQAKSEQTKNQQNNIQTSDIVQITQSDTKFFTQIKWWSYGIAFIILLVLKLIL